MNGAAVRDVRVRAGDRARPGDTHSRRRAVGLDRVLQRAVGDHPEAGRAAGSDDLRGARVPGDGGAVLAQRRVGRLRRRLWDSPDLGEARRPRPQARVPRPLRPR